MRWLVLVGLLIGAPAAADVVAPRRVTASLHGRTARFVVRVRAVLDGDAFPAGELEVGVPGGGIVTRASAFAGGTEHRLALMPADAANDAFWGLGSASGDRKPWGVLVTAGGDVASIEIAAPAAATPEIELEMEAPTCFARDTRWVQVPASWRDAVNGVDAPDGCTGQSDGPWLGFAAPMTRDVRIGALAGRLSVTSGDFARVELDLARELEDVPADLATAIVIDGSRSVSADEREAQRAIVASYVRHAPHTMVQLIGYARRARALLPSWAATEAAAPRIDRELRALAGLNGSNIDAGLAEAGAWLSRLEGTRRVIVFTDERLAARLESTTGEEWANLLPPGTLVHVIALRDDKGPLERDDNVTFAALAQLTGGIGVAGTLAPDVDATLLVRPTSLDRVEVKGAGWDDLTGSTCSADRMPAGTSCTWLGKGTPSAGPIVIDGLLWNRPMKRVVVPDPAQARAIARELSVLGGLEAPVQAEVDRAAMAVNAVWSLYAAWGGDGGYAERLGFGHLEGTGGATDSTTISDTIGTAHVMPQVDLSAQLAGPLAACGDAHGTIEIDLTLDEIVDVAVAHAGAQQHCLEDAVWNTLVAVPNAEPRSHARIVL